MESNTSEARGVADLIKDSEQQVHSSPCIHKTGTLGFVSKALTTSGIMEGERPIRPVMAVANLKKSLRLTPCLLKVSQKVSIVGTSLIEY